MSELPEWVAQRVGIAMNEPDYKAEEAVAEFLRIIEERGLRIVPVRWLTADMACAATTWPRQAIPIEHEAICEAAPPLAELLEDRHG